MRVVGTLAIFVTVLCYHHVSSNEGHVNWDPTEPTKTERRPCNVYTNIYWRDGQGDDVLLTGTQSFLNKGLVTFGFGKIGGPVHAMRTSKGVPYVRDGQNVKTISEAEFDKYGITEWKEPPPSFKAHQLPSNPQHRRSLSPNPQFQRSLSTAQESHDQPNPKRLRMS
ncbi:uncharacterized protein LOC117173422 [Belonocnema kinseyi]|uniref:uncharacterized protein LOC117173422 n=1 Tax=Belonocnema kinseyi TaxID=2817044 RepID=UPI00143DC8EF|nr:uncharacterized protein LOC117173422 [Belonocnema kinseyi]